LGTGNGFNRGVRDFLNTFVEPWLSGTAMPVRNRPTIATKATALAII
jgi:hypothetical protein